MANTRVMELSGILPGEPGNGEPYGSSPGGGQPGKPRRGRALAIAVACAVVAGSGAFAVADALSSPPAPPAAVAGAPSPASAPAGQAAVLSGLLNDAAAAGQAVASPGAVSAPGAAKPHGRAALRRERRALARLRRLGGMHGEFTFQTKSGPRTLAFERGTVTSVTSAAITVRAADGTTWTWQFTSASVVRNDGTRVARAALAAGQRVFVGGPVPGSARDARLIVIGDRSGGDS